MSKKLREIQSSIIAKNAEMQKYIDGAEVDEDVLKGMIDDIESLENKRALLEKAEKISTPQKAEKMPEFESKKKPSGFGVILKMLKRQRLDDDEKALITGDDAENGENNLIPEDVKTEINELRRSYVSAKDIVTVEKTNSLKGSVLYESGTPAGLVNFDDGDDLTGETAVSFTPKTFAIKFFGKLIPISKILLGAEKGGLMSYLNRWFLKNAVISENTEIFTKLKSGYNSGTPKAIAGWKALKKSINVDLDPSCKLSGVIVTNQSGFACLDEEEDENGRPILQPNPANPTEKLFQGLPVKVFPDAQLANINSTHSPIFYGDLKAACTFVEYQGLQFDVSEHYLFNKNQDCLKVIEGFDVMSTDTSAYIYGSFSATPAAASGNS